MQGIKKARKDACAGAGAAGKGKGKLGLASMAWQAWLGYFVSFFNRNWDSLSWHQIVSFSNRE